MEIRRGAYMDTEQNSQKKTNNPAGANEVSYSLRLALWCYVYLFFAPLFYLGLYLIPYLSAVAIILGLTDLWKKRRYRWYGLALALCLPVVWYIVWWNFVSMVSNPFEQPH